MSSFQSPLLLPLLLPACMVMPGYLLARRLPVTPPEKLCASIAFSGIILYLFVLFTYWLKAGPRAYFAFSAVAMGGLFFHVRELRAHLEYPPARGMLLAFSGLLLWNLIFLALPHHYSGGKWEGDWEEHYQRTLFFIRQMPVETRFIGGYTLTARPPMMNTITAFFGKQTTEAFWLFQFVSCFLNLLVFLPGWLLATRFGRGRRPAQVGFTCLFALSPMMLQNTTYTWTKLFSAFYVLLALWFYLRAWGKGARPVLFCLCFVLLTAGFLVHYSAAPFALLLGGDFLVRSWHRQCLRPLRLAGIAFLPALLVATWVGWSMAVFGLRGTVATNTSVTDSARLSYSDNLLKIGKNLWRTLVPNVPEAAGWDMLNRTNWLSRCRDIWFLLYQGNLLLAFGIVGFVGLGFVLKNRSGTGRSPVEKGFWGCFISAGIFLGVAVHGGYEPFGVAHVVLQPVVVIGLAALAAGLVRLPSGLRLALLGGALFDFLLGILLHFHVQSYVVIGFTGPGGKWLLRNPGLSPVAMDQGARKLLGGHLYLGDPIAAWKTEIEGVALAGGALYLLMLARVLFPPGNIRSRTTRRFVSLEKIK